MKLLLDTTAASDIMHRRPHALARLRELKPRDIGLSSPVLAEIRFGLERLEARSRRRILLETELARLQQAIAWADWDEHAAECFGILKAKTLAAGNPVDDMDLIVASIAVSREAAVATANTRHFERIPGLAIEVWSATSPP